jgi:DNA-directed RNA polymerase subunit H (RpoH/RPB5)
MSKKKVLKRTGIIIISSIIVLFVAWQLLKEFKIKAFIVDSLQTELNHYFEDSVQLEIDNITFSIFDKEILLEDIKINLIANRKDTLASLELPSLNFTWNNHWEAFNNQFYKFQLLKLENAKLLLPIDFKKIKRNKASRPSFDGKFELQIQEFILTEGEILFYDKRNGRSGRINSKYNLKAKDLYFKKGDIPNSFQDVASKIFLEFHDLTYYLKDDFHLLDIKKLTFDLFQQHITLNSAHFRPIYSPEKFAELKGEEVNYIDILLDSIQINSINWKGDSMISATSVFTKDINLKVVKDKNYILPDDRFVPVLVEQLKHHDISIDVRECIVKNLNLSYYEIPEGKTDKGIVTISNINGEIINITNRKDSIEKYGKYLMIKAYGNLYNEGKLTADIRYDLNSKYGYFTVAGNLEPMPIGAINQYLSKSYPVEISSGNVDELYFNYSGGNHAVSGEMEFKYSDLKIKFHKVLNDEEKGDKALSWLANIALSQENPRKNGRFRVGKIQFTRDTRKSMFSYWSNSLVSGFQSTVGMDKPARIEKLEKEKDDRNLWQKIGFGKEDESE